jgi:outer membrane receptor protein involved in Fe transport
MFKNFTFLLALSAIVSALSLPGYVRAKEPSRHFFNIQAQSLDGALRSFALQSHREIFFAPELAQGKVTSGVQGEYDDMWVLATILANTGLSYKVTPSAAILVEDPAAQSRPGAHTPAFIPASLALAERMVQGSATDANVTSTSTLTEATASPDSGSSLPEVVVTAEKRSELLKDVPLAVTAVDAQSLLATNQVSLGDYFRSIPGLTLNDDGEGFKQLIIRGIATGSENTPTVGIYIDDTPIGSSTSAARGDVLVPDLDPTDLQRIEVLKGPQGTLYGASNMGGLLKYVTIAPDLRELNGHVELDGIGVDHGGLGYGVRGAINLPLVSDVLAVRLSASNRLDPGYIDNIRGGDDINSTVVTNTHTALLWQASDALAVKFSVLTQDRNGRGTGREDYDFATGAPTYGDLTVSRVPGTLGNEEKQQIYNGSVNWTLPWAVFTSSTSFARNSYDSLDDVSELFGPIFQEITGDPDFGAKIHQKYSTAKFTQEFRLNGSQGPFDWLAGAFLTSEQSHYYQVVDNISIADGSPIEGGPDAGNGFVNSRYREAAVFGDLTYHFTNQLSLQAGLRYSYDRQNDTSINEAGVLSGPASTISETSHEGVPTFVVAPEFKLTSDTSFYARIASGYRAGGPNYSFSGPGVNPTYNADRTINYEAGVKSYFLDRQIYAELSAFYIDWSKIQLLGLNADHEEFYINAGGAVSQGLEAAVQYQPFRGMNLAATLDYTDAHLSDNRAFDVGIDGRDGERLPFVPRLAGSLSAEYTWPVGRGWSGRLGSDYSYQGARLTSFQSTVNFPPSLSDPRYPRPVLPGYSVVNLHAGLDTSRFQATVFVKNLLDKRAFTSANGSTLDNSSPLYSVAVIQPATVGLTLTMKF